MWSSETQVSLYSWFSLLQLTLLPLPVHRERGAAKTKELNCLRLFAGHGFKSVIIQCGMLRLLSLKYSWNSSFITMFYIYLKLYFIIIFWVILGLKCTHGKPSKDISWACLLIMFLAPTYSMSLGLHNGAVCASNITVKNSCLGPHFYLDHWTLDSFSSLSLNL